MWPDWRHQDRDWFLTEDKRGERLVALVFAEVGIAEAAMLGARECLSRARDACS